MLCPTVLPITKDSYWPHIVNEDFMLDLFIDLQFLKEELKSVSKYRLLCVVREPDATPTLPPSLSEFDFIGFDLLELITRTSALTNCGGFEGAFTPDDLSPKGLICDYGRARQVQAELRRLYPEEHHAKCEVWAVFSATSVHPPRTS
jgi:hypothetical protein